MMKFDGIFLLGRCSLSASPMVQIGEAGHAAPKAVSVLSPTALEHDVAAVVVAQTSAQLLIIHAGLPLTLAPQPRNLGRIPRLVRQGGRGRSLEWTTGQGAGSGRVGSS